jgi:hypothetical protein
LLPCELVVGVGAPVEKVTLELDETCAAELVFALVL